MTMFTTVQNAPTVPKLPLHLPRSPVSQIDEHYDTDNAEN
jgi:hypothetical protein